MIRRNQYPTWVLGLLAVILLVTAILALAACGAGGGKSESNAKQCERLANENLDRAIADTNAGKAPTESASPPACLALTEEERLAVFTKVMAERGDEIWEGVEGIEGVDPNAGHYDKLCELVEGKKDVTPAMEKAMYKLYTTLPDPESAIDVGPFQEVDFIHTNRVEEARDEVREAYEDSWEELNRGALQRINDYCGDPYRELR